MPHTTSQLTVVNDRAARHYLAVVKYFARRSVLGVLESSVQFSATVATSYRAPLTMKDARTNVLGRAASVHAFNWLGTLIGVRVTRNDRCQKLTYAVSVHEREVGKNGAGMAALTMLIHQILLHDHVESVLVVLRHVLARVLVRRLVHAFNFHHLRALGRRGECTSLARTSLLRRG